MSANDNSFPSHADRLLADPLLCVRERGQAERIVGYVGDVPVELIIAADALPLRLRGAPGKPTPLADRYLESAFSPEVRAIAEQWLSGQLDGIDTVVFPRSNDSAQRLYYYLCELQRTGRCRGPQPLLFDVATIQRRTSLEHTLQSTRALAAALGSDLSAVREAMARTRERTLLMEKLSGSESFRIGRAQDFDWRPSFDASFKNWAATITARTFAKRILFVGNSPPDARFHVAVEKANATINHECTESRAGIPNSHSDDCLTALAHSHHFSATLAQQMFRSSVFVTALAHRVGADGVILWAIEEDETLPWEIPRQLQSLDDANIPVLSLTRQPWLADDAVLNTVRQFAASLERRV